MNQNPVYLCLVILGLGLFGILVVLLNVAGNSRSEIMIALMPSCAIVIAGSIIAVAIASQRRDA